MIYYISDIHFNDLRVFNKCLKPFKNLVDYKEEIIKRWNLKVNEEDIIYILGDLADDIEVIKILRKLKGHKHLIIGNHDLKLLDEYKKSQIFESIEFMKLIDDKGRKVFLCHYPIMDWMDFNYGSYHVYGHIHNKTKNNGTCYNQIKEYFKDKLGFNSSVDVTNYEPVTLDEMIKLKEVNINEPYIN